MSYAESHARAVRRYQKRHPNRARASAAVLDALHSGQLVRQPCSICGATIGVEAHHEDYDAPLAITWLCGKHHRKLHNERRPKREKAPRPKKERNQKAPPGRYGFLHSVRIWDARKEARLTQASAAEAAGIALTHYARIEYGLHLPSVILARRIADVLGRTVDELWPRSVPGEVPSGSNVGTDVHGDSPDVQLVRRP